MTPVIGQCELCNICLWFLNHKKYITFFFQWYFIQCVFSTEKKDNFLLLSIICSLVEENVGDLEKVVQVCYNTCKLNKYQKSTLFQNITFHQFYCFKAVCLLGKAFVDLTSIHDVKAEPGNCVKKFVTFKRSQQHVLQMAI